MKKDDYPIRSSEQIKPGTRQSASNLTSSPYDDSFTEIPRAAQESYNNIFLSRSQAKTDHFFEAAESEAEYGNIFNSSKKPSKKDLRPKVTEDYNYKVWNFFTTLNKRNSDDDEDSSEQKSNTFSFQSRRTEENGNNDMLDVAMIQNSADYEEVQVQAEKGSLPRSEKTQEITYKSKTLEEKLQNMKTASKAVSITIEPSGCKDQTIKPRKIFKRMFNPPKHKFKPYFGLFEEKIQREFVEFQEVDSPFRQSPHEYRKTRIRPLRYWLGQRIVYGKEGAKGKIVVKEQ